MILFSLFYKILQPPAHYHHHHLYSIDTCNSWILFFNEKIHKVHHHLIIIPTITPSSELLTSCQSFSNFHLTNASEISYLIQKSKPSTCQLDALPTALVKSYISSLLPLISAIFYSSLTTGIVPTLFKTSVIPILEKILDRISHLPSISKILEKNHCHSTPLLFNP